MADITGFTLRSPAECLVAAAAIEGAIHLIDDEESAQILAKLADQWRAEAVAPVTPSRTDRQPPNPLADAKGGQDLGGSDA